jgi:hypothetical protein
LKGGGIFWGRRGHDGLKGIRVDYVVLPGDIQREV